MNTLQLVSITINDKKFTTSKDTLIQLKWFKKYFDDNIIFESELIDINLDHMNIKYKDFEIFLDYLRDRSLHELPEHCKYIYYKFENNDETKSDGLDDFTNTLKLNIGGEKFEISKDLLEKTDFFKSLIERWDHVKEHFIDRNPKKFKHVIKYVEDENYTVPYDCISELEFYGIKTNDDNHIINNVIKETQASTFYEHGIYYDNENKAYRTPIKDLDDCSMRDSYFYAFPEITYFRQIYRKNTKFMAEYKKFSLCKTDDFTYEIKIPSGIHLIANMFWIIDLDVTNIFKWNHKKVHLFIEKINVKFRNIDYVIDDNIIYVDSIIKNNTKTGKETPGQIIIPFKQFYSIEHNVHIPNLVLNPITITIKFRDPLALNLGNFIKNVSMLAKLYTISSTEYGRFKVNPGYASILPKYQTYKIEMDEKKNLYELELKKNMNYISFTIFFKNDDMMTCSKTILNNFELIVTDKKTKEPESKIKVDGKLMKYISEIEKNIRNHNIYNYDLHDKKTMIMALTHDPQHYESNILKLDIDRRNSLAKEIVVVCFGLSILKISGDNITEVEFSDEIPEQIENNDNIIEIPNMIPIIPDPDEPPILIDPPEFVEIQDGCLSKLRRRLIRIFCCLRI